MSATAVAMRSSSGRSRSRSSSSESIALMARSPPSRAPRAALRARARVASCKPPETHSGAPDLPKAPTLEQLQDDNVALPARKARNCLAEHGSQHQRASRVGRGCIVHSLKRQDIRGPAQLTTRLIYKSSTRDLMKPTEQKESVR